MKKVIISLTVLFIILVGIIFSQTNSFFINEDGKVFIGTGEQQSELQVNGRIRDKTGFIMPVGTIIAWGGEVAEANGSTDVIEPVEAPGWLLCNGAGIDFSEQENVDKYGDLRAVIGNNFGNEGNVVKIPDLRGMFLRGVDHGAENDPDRLTRTTGDRVGSRQEDELKSHNHSHKDKTHKTARGWGDSKDVADDSTSDSTRSTGYTGGSETRPKNVYVNYLIKY